MAATPSQICFRFLVLWHLAFRKAKNYMHIKFRPDISIHGQVITTSGCWKQTPPYLSSTPGFNELFIVIGMWFCTGLPNFMQIKWSPTELWRHIDFTRWRSQCYKSTSCCWFGHVWRLERSRAIGIPNFHQMSQSTAEILLLPVSENKRPTCWNSTSGFDPDLLTASGMWFCTGLPNFMQIGWSPTELWRHINFTR